ncbi:hypothetical protein THAOC_05296 [Thalassiosira oceanica]|uniref:Uncharacterized protein n=1 Tax=Thalassiosira oceanica TaxID=159749 RepID=K0THH0_THAOC|nr:hypothetical protein THAOC_05296 [Thalassiosira oceanica]|eukprot:EJK73101.1 hypothetical protein THAOC_05296 [Thalassiosira oceanica]
MARRARSSATMAPVILVMVSALTITDSTSQASITGLTRSTQPIVFGHMAVQIRDWRIRQIDSDHLSVTNENGNVSRVYQSDGTVHGNVASLGGYIDPDLGEPTCAYLTSSFLQLGDWRFGEIGDHLSVTHKSGQSGKTIYFVKMFQRTFDQSASNVNLLVSTAMTYKNDGTMIPGPTDYNAWFLVDNDVLAGSKEGCQSPSQSPSKAPTLKPIGVVN